MNIPSPNDDLTPERQTNSASGEQKNIEPFPESIYDYADETTYVGILEQSHGQITLTNPLCGDETHLSFQLTPDRRIEKIRHQTNGCELCRASANIMCNALTGANLAQIKEVRSTLQMLLTQNQFALWSSTDLQKLEVFTSIDAINDRKNCVMLPFNALLGAMQVGT